MAAGYDGDGDDNDDDDDDSGRDGKGLFQGSTHSVEAVDNRQ